MVESEATLPPLDLEGSRMLVDAEWTLLESLQSLVVVVVFGARR